MGAKELCKGPSGTGHVGGQEKERPQAVRRTYGYQAEEGEEGGNVRGQAPESSRLCLDCEPGIRMRFVSGSDGSRLAVARASLLPWQ